MNNDTKIAMDLMPTSPLAPKLLEVRGGSVMPSHPDEFDDAPRTAKAAASLRDAAAALPDDHLRGPPLDPAGQLHRSKRPSRLACVGHLAQPWQPRSRRLAVTGIIVNDRLA